MSDSKYPDFEKLGGKVMLEKISKVFYDKVYEHAWIGLYFKEVPQERIESQQVDFMQGALGGPTSYCGRLPVPAHKHMFINEELFDIRQELLQEAFVEACACQELIDKWLRIDNAFRPKLVKKNIGDCEKRFFTDEIVLFKDPRKKAA